MLAAIINLGYQIPCKVTENNDVKTLYILSEVFCETYFTSSACKEMTCMYMKDKGSVFNSQSFYLYIFLYFCLFHISLRICYYPASSQKLICHPAAVVAFCTKKGPLLNVSHPGP